jgi:HTH-type transcriptional regulator, competence development regulator
MDEINELGKFLRTIRERKSLSLRAVERQSGVSNAYLSQIESGKINQPSPNILHKLSEIYEVPYNDLLKLAGYPSSETLDQAVDESFLTRLGPVTEEEQDALTEYLEFLRSRRSRKD